MNKLDRDRIADMLEYSETAIILVGETSAEGLATDQRTFLAARKAIEIVGEAANQVSPERQAELPDVPWREVIAMRHRLVHGYRSVRAELIVATVRQDLPPLVAILRRALENAP